MTKSEKSLLTIVGAALAVMLIIITLGISNDTRLTNACLNGNNGACEALKGN